MDSITKGFTDLSQKYINDGISLKDAMQDICQKTPGFKNDEIFLNMFQCCFMIELCKKEIFKLITFF